MRRSVLDTECYVDYWLARFSTGEVFQLCPDYPLDVAGLYETLRKYTLVTFKGESYDLPIITLALAGATNEQLKMASDQLIVQGIKHWELLKQWGVKPLYDVDHIDLFNVTPGTGSLKSYGARMHTRKIQDLPIDPGECINWAQRALLREYCGNDLIVTGELLETFETQIALREDMSAEYGIDLRSKSDAQIAEAVMKKLLGYKPDIPYIPPGETFYFRPADWLQFQSLNVIDIVTKYPFVISESGGVSPNYHMRFVDWGDDQKRLDDHGAWVKRPPGWKHEPIQIGNTFYALGLGGLHSKESSVTHRADDEFVLTDHDVRGYYPSLMIKLGIYPEQIGPVFREIFKGWKVTRDIQKAIAEAITEPKEVRKTAKKKANTGKTLTNGTFGKLGSAYSIFYAPSEMIRVTVTGQLALLMLIEMLELSGISVVSANTDGIVIKCRRGQEWLRDSIVQWWESVTEFETEMAEYSILAMRDVNSYVTIKTDGEVKLKGAFAPPEPGASGWPNPTGQICTDAIVEYLKNGTPLEQTIRACTDMRQFVYVRSVKGGGVVQWRPSIPKVASKKRQGELLTRYGFDDYVALVAWSTADTEYLGKTVRWYYAKDSHATIRYNGSGNLVPRTEGCEPLMELEWRDNIDYDWYVREARSMLADIGAS